jgi:polysaccharide pyruvyl transferase WcaK-like protein
MNKINIRVLGSYGESNFGDDALLHTIHKYFMTDFSEHNVIYESQDGKIKFRENNNALEIVGVSANAEHPSVTIYGGGTQFYSFKDRNIYTKPLFLLKLLCSPRSLLKYVGYKLNFNPHKSNHKTLALGIGLGPFVDKKVKDNVFNNLAKMEYASVRDSYSYDQSIRRGLSNVDHHTDICYSMESDMFILNKEIGSIKHIGIIVRDWNLEKNGRKYYEQILSFAELKKGEGYLVTYIVFSSKQDIEWIDKLEKSNEELLVWNSEKNNLNDFMVKLSTFDVFITARYHGAIFASLLRKPFITIEIDPKLKLLSEVYNTSSKNWSYPFSLEELNTYFSEIENDYYSFVMDSDIETKKQVKIVKDMESSFTKELHKVLKDIRD